MAAGERITFGLRAGGRAEEELVVLRLAGREALSRPYAFDVELQPASGEPLDLSAFLGAEAQLALRRPDGAAAFVHGECLAAEYLCHEGGFPRYRLRLGPRLSRLGRAGGNRVFQGQTAPEIVQAVLDQHRVAHRAALSASYPQREYVVQHRESDLAFVARLLAREGIWYRFEQSDGAHTLVLCDGASGFEDGPQVPVRQGGQGEGEEHLFALARSRSLVSNATARQDYDFEHPGVDLTARAGAGDLEVYEYPGGHTVPSDGSRSAKARLEELGVPSDGWAGRGNALGVRPGAKIQVEGAGAIAVVAVEHHGEQQHATGQAALGSAYANAFTALDASQQYRAPRCAPPRLMGPQTATVVGPAGEEIHVDPHGRIKVQFHWDRDGRRDERSSCWVRAAQAWAGPGMGASFVPRLGQEVLVRFLEGDPDRPLVTGALYNGANPPPLQLPADRTRSTLRTDSSKGSGGFNELLLEDAQGMEQVFAHAQKDANAVVENDASAEVRHDAALEVGQDRRQQVGRDQSLEVGRDDVAAVRRDQELHVRGDRETAVLGGQEESVGGDQTMTVGRARHLSIDQASAEAVALAASLTVGAKYTVTVGADHDVAVGGLRSVLVGGARVEVVGLTREERVGQSSSARVGGEFATSVAGAAGVAVGGDGTTQASGAEGCEVGDRVVESARAIVLQADAFRLIVGGKKIVEMTSSGVKISGVQVTVAGSAVALKGSSISKSGGAPPSGAAARVRRLKALRGARAWSKVLLLDQDGKPIANERFRVELPDGAVQLGTTDGSGAGAVPSSKDGSVKVTFPRLTQHSVKKK